jgi:hypothetical protein
MEAIQRLHLVSGAGTALEGRRTGKTCTAGRAADYQSEDIYFPRHFSRNHHLNLSPKQVLTFALFVAAFAAIKKWFARSILLRNRSQQPSQPEQPPCVPPRRGRASARSRHWLTMQYATQFLDGRAAPASDRVGLPRFVDWRIALVMYFSQAIALRGYCARFSF